MATTPGFVTGKENNSKYSPYKFDGKNMPNDRRRQTGSLIEKLTLMQEMSKSPTTSSAEKQQSTAPGAGAVSVANRAVAQPALTLTLSENTAPSQTITVNSGAPASKCVSPATQEISVNLADTSAQSNNGTAIKITSPVKRSQGVSAKASVSEAMEKQYGALGADVIRNIPDSVIEKNIPYATDVVEGYINNGQLGKDALERYPYLITGLATFYAADEMNNSRAATLARRVAYTESAEYLEKARLREEEAEKAKKDEKAEGKWGVLDTIGAILTAASSIPGIDTFTNMGEFVVDLLRCDYGSAALDLVGIVPFVGELADTAKVARKGKQIINAIDAGADVAKAVDKASDAAKAAGKTRNVDKALVQELIDSGEKCTPEDIIDITKSSSGKIIWLETGRTSGGFNHIIKEHGNEFIEFGISIDEIPDYIMQAVRQGNIVGYQGTKTPRTIYEFIYKGKKQRVAVQVGSNGYIVGANPKGSVK